MIYSCLENEITGILIRYFNQLSQIPVLESLLTKCDSILLGGGMIFTFYRALGMSTGASIVEEDFIDMARGLIDKAEAKGVKLLLPKDVVVANKFAADAVTKMVSAWSHYISHFAWQRNPYVDLVRTLPRLVPYDSAYRILFADAFEYRLNQQNLAQVFIQAAQVLYNTVAEGKVPKAYAEIGLRETLRLLYLIHAGCCHRDPRWLDGPRHWHDSRE